jgi:hypothetical protein
MSGPETPPAAALDRALIEEAARKSGLVWAAVSGGPAQALWHAWVDGAVVVVGDGPGEQPLGGLTEGGTATVTVRSKDKGGRLVSFPADVAALATGSDEWAAAVAELKGKRLNAPDGEAMTERWSRECRVLRLTPAGAPEPLPADGDAARPRPTPAITRRPVPPGLPKLLLRRKGR